MVVPVAFGWTLERFFGHGSSACSRMTACGSPPLLGSGVPDPYKGSRTLDGRSSVRAQAVRTSARSPESHSVFLAREAAV